MIVCLYVNTENISGNLHKTLNSSFIWGMGMMERRDGGAEGFFLTCISLYGLNFI